MTSTLFESFMIFYLLEVLVLSIIAFQVFREMKQEETEENIKTDQDKKGPSAADMIKMRALAKEMERQSK
jgi:flagellar biosynthesis/type III secretory pathway M-ring protein FliF/YscJ